jgi:hypothetical protein
MELQQEMTKVQADVAAAERLHTPKQEPLLKCESYRQLMEACSCMVVFQSAYIEGGMYF